MGRGEQQHSFPGRGCDPSQRRPRLRRQHLRGVRGSSRRGGGGGQGPRADDGQWHAVHALLATDLSPEYTHWPANPPTDQSHRTTNQTTYKTTYQTTYQTTNDATHPSTFQTSYRPTIATTLPATNHATLFTPFQAHRTAFNDANTALLATHVTAHQTVEPTHITTLKPHWPAKHTAFVLSHEFSADPCAHVLYVLALHAVRAALVRAHFATQLSFLPTHATTL